MTTGFQQTANIYLAPAVAGDFASTNPRQANVGPEGGFVASSSGVTVGCFAWIYTDGLSINSTGSGVPDGFVHRENNALITTYLAETSSTVAQGFPVAMFRTGDFFVKSTVGAAVKGNKAFAKLTDGTIQFAAAGATVSGFIETAFTCTRACLVNELAVMSL